MLQAKTKRNVITQPRVHVHSKLVTTIREHFRVNDRCYAVYSTFLFVLFVYLINNTYSGKVPGCFMSTKRVIPGVTLHSTVLPFRNLRV